LLLRIHSADIAGAAADHRKAQADEVLARTQLDRAKDLFERGAIAKKDLDVAQGAAVKAAVDVETTAERLRIFGVDPANASPGGVVDIVAPVSGVITEQNVTPAAGVKTLDNSPTLFTISDLSHIWIVCDVYENDLPAVRVGDAATIHVAAYPDRLLTGRIDNIAPILDPTIRTAKVRIEVSNPGILRVGMFVTAVFHGQIEDTRPVVPATAILHLHDREWVYVPAGDGRFQRKEVVSGQTLPGNAQELLSGLRPGDRVVANALVLQNTVGQ
jgi:cobalt-zinc-cadmium efflux system membrane fusion protein